MSTSQSPRSLGHTEVDSAGKLLTPTPKGKVTPKHTLSREWIRPDSSYHPLSNTNLPTTSHSTGTTTITMGTRISSTDKTDGTDYTQQTSSHNTSDAGFEESYQAWLSAQPQTPQDDDSDSGSEAGEEHGEYPLLPVMSFLRPYRLSDGCVTHPPLFCKTHLPCDNLSVTCLTSTFRPYGRGDGR